MITTGKQLAAALAVLLLSMPAQAALDASPAPEDRPAASAPKADEARRLSIAAAEGDAGACTVLLDKGADPNAAGEDGDTPLIAAAMADRLETAKLLLDRGADPNLAAMGRTALHAAATNENPAMAMLLLDRGARIDAADDAGMTPLMYASMESCTETVKALLKRGASPAAADRDGGTALMYAAWDCLPLSLEALLQGGAPQKDGTGGPFAVLVSGNPDWYMFFGQLGRGGGKGAALRFYADVRDDESPLPMPKAAWVSFDGGSPEELKWTPVRGDAGGCGGEFADPAGLLKRLSQAGRLVLRVGFTNGQSFSAEFPLEASRPALMEALAAAEKEGWSAR